MSVDVEFNVWILNERKNEDSPEKVFENVSNFVQKLILIGLQLHINNASLFYSDTSTCRSYKDTDPFEEDVSNNKTLRDSGVLLSGTMLNPASNHLVLMKKNSDTK